MGIFKILKSRRTMSKINKLNNNMLELYYQTEGIYKGSINLNYDEIKFPENITSKIYLYSDDGTLQIFILNKDGEKIAVLNCLQTKKMLADNERILEQKKAKEIEREREIREKEKQEEKKMQEMVKKREKLNNSRYDNYIDFLKKNGANEVIINLPAVQELIKDIISRGDLRVVYEGRSPIVYNKPKADGTFNISGRTAGPVANEIYEMTYCNDGDENHFIKLIRKQNSHVHYMMDDPIGTPDGYDVTDIETIYISKTGEIIDKNKTRK